MTAAIFDLDGLLIDSEPLWKEAEISVFRSLGVPLTATMCQDTLGVRVDAVVRHWHERYPWKGESLDAVETRIVDVVMQLIVDRGAPLPGVTETMDLLSAAQYKLAVASSSPLRLIRTALDKLGLSGSFSVLHSAEGEEHGKPHPAVYLSTMSRLGVAAHQCIAFEDSVPGVQAARRAGARVIAVPDPADIANPGFADADIVLVSLTEFSLERLT